MTRIPKNDPPRRTKAGASDPILGQSELERLLDRIQCGTIEDVGDLDQDEIELLQGHCPDGEELAALFDRLRGTSREKG